MNINSTLSLESPTTISDLLKSSKSLPITPVCKNGRFGFHISDGRASFSILKDTSLFAESSQTLAELVGDSRVIVVFDPKIYQMHGKTIRTYFEAHKQPTIRIVLPDQEPNELNKSFPVAERIIDVLASHNVGGGDKVVLVGGGVTMDVGKFALSIFRRGKPQIPYIAIPTTLVALIDAAFSPKSAINVGFHKNTAGTFQYPEVVLYNPGLLNTISGASFTDGLAEIAKIAIVGSPTLFDELFSAGLPFLRRQLCSDQAGPLLEDAIQLFHELKWTGPYPGNEPASIRSFGHAFSRELEGASGYTVSHGQAVSIEMAIATNLAANLRILPEFDRARILSLLSHLGLSLYSHRCDAAMLWRGAFERKVANGEHFYFPVPECVGKGRFLEKFTIEDLRKAILDTKECEEILSLS